MGRPHHPSTDPALCYSRSRRLKNHRCCSSCRTGYDRWLSLGRHNRSTAATGWISQASVWSNGRGGRGTRPLPKWGRPPLSIPAAGAGGSMTSLKTTGTGRSETRCAFMSHQFRVARGMPHCRAKATRVGPLRQNCSAICNCSALLARFGDWVAFLISMHPAYRTASADRRCTWLTAYV